MLFNENAQKYKLLAEKLYAKCQEVQAENERCVLRINTVKKMMRRRLREVEMLKRRLDKHNDNWRSLPMVAPHPKRKIEQKRGPKPKPKLPNDDTKKKVRKQRTKKNAPEANGTIPVQNVQEINPLQHFTEQQAKQLLLVQQQNVDFTEAKFM